MKQMYTIIISIFTLFIFVYANLALSVDNEITSNDVEAILSLKVDEPCINSNGLYKTELECLISIQAAVQAIGGKECAENPSDIIEPSNFLKRNYGCCFDRARFIEKAARHYGYETRHIFLIRPKYSLSLTNFLPLKQSSHATSEILTANGWLGVDSNEPFILTDSDDTPHTYRYAIENLDKFPNMSPYFFYEWELDLIYGLYSRHGNFHGKNFPGPEFVFSELKWNFI